MTAEIAPFDVTGKVVLITGANRGIGSALVDTFLERGAKKVYGAVRDLASLTVSDERIVPLYLDLSIPSSIADAAKKSQDVDIVINNAGILLQAQPLDVDALSNLKQQMQVNVYGLIELAQQYAPILKVNGGGVLVQLNSLASFRSGFPQVSTYSASKAASYSITQSLKHQLAEQNTRVVSVHPGPIATDMIAAAGEEFIKMAEHPKNVALEVIQAIEDGSFHVFPDAKAKNLAVIVGPYTKEIIEGGKMYG
uniref:Uncharacterized protein n=1 Tax=Entomoneis paludosa TaxID=265537 RepID=A0A7S2YPD0_9STRA|mmetsp:Transcript_4350/g.9344  ORF Transcript_4350/g.9344 Transcript_4350/m.9344 type:complete len:252 (+) Transcript_4350:60-815(+)